MSTVSIIGELGKVPHPCTDKCNSNTNLPPFIDLNVCRAFHLNTDVNAGAAIVFMLISDLFRAWLVKKLTFSQHIPLRLFLFSCVCVHFGVCNGLPLGKRRNPLSLFSGLSFKLSNVKTTLLKENGAFELQ